MDHIGVPNAQLMKDNSKIAAFNQGKSVAEQNSCTRWEKAFTAFTVDPIMQEDLKDEIVIKHLMWHTPCSPGTFTGSGTSDCSWSSTRCA
jgi:hypothetical protein